jgi:hypothetical protein
MINIGPPVAHSAEQGIMKDITKEAVTIASQIREDLRELRPALNPAIMVHMEDPPPNNSHTKEGIDISIFLGSIIK